MATYQFSALADGQAITFNPSADILNFDQASIAGADIRAVAEGANLRISVVSGTSTGKDVLLLNVTPLQLATTNVSFANGSRLLFGDNTAGTAADNSANTLTGTAGNDLLQGFGGADTMNGGAGNDTYIVGTGDVLSDSGGIDMVVTDITWSLGTTFENLTMTGTANITMQGNNLDNLIIGNAGNNTFNARAGNDTIQAGAGNDRIDMFGTGFASYGDEVVDGGAGFDTIDFSGYAKSAIVLQFWAGQITGGGDGGLGTVTFSNLEMFVTGAFNDSLVGSDGAQSFDARGGDDTLWGYDGNDTLNGGAGNDQINSGLGNDVVTGGVGADRFMIRGDAEPASFDTILDFASGEDKFQFHANYSMQSLGASGNFVAGDERFYAGAAAHDASDRVIWDGTSLWFDSDGNGSIAPLRIANVTGTVVATDIFVQDGAPAGTNVGGEGPDSINGTSAGETIDGLGGNDTINGLGGHDRLVGSEGRDVLNGGDGNDTLDGWYSEQSFWDNELVADTLNGGAGDDRFNVDHVDDVLSDTGGVDTVHTADMDWTLAAGFENLVIHNDRSEAGGTGIGNALNNHMSLTYGPGELIGGGGNDTLVSFTAWGWSDLQGGDGDDSLAGYGYLDGGSGNDTLEGGYGNFTGGAGADTFLVRDPWSDPDVLDFSSGFDRIRLDARNMTELGTSGTLSSNDPRFYAAAGATGGHDADDRIIFDTSSGQLYFDRDGIGGEAAIALATFHNGGSPASVVATDITIENGQVARVGTAGNDSLVGGTGNDVISGLGGNDTLIGLEGLDTLDGGAGVDSMNGGAHSDLYYATSGDVLVEDMANWDGGQDTVVASVSWTLGENFEHLELAEGAPGALNATGNAGSNRITGNSANNRIDGGGGGQDDLFGRGGDDTIVGSAYSVYGEAGNDVLTGTYQVDGGDGNDRINGGTNIRGGAGNDTIAAGAGNSWEIYGGADADTFIVTHFGSANADRYVDFASGQDELRFDASAFSGLGASGDFSASDDRFYAAAGATAAHDATDRLIYNTSNGELWYDADGIGGLGAIIVATFGSTWPNVVIPNLQATDIAVDNGTSSNQTITGTAGNDSLTGGAGNDTLDGGAGTDTMNGGLGNDTYIVTAGDVLSDPGGVDTVRTDITWALADAFENLTMTGTGAITMQGNNLNNLIIGNAGNNIFNARAGDDTIQAGGGNDRIDMFGTGFPSYGNEVVDGGTGTDTIDFSGYAKTGIVVNLATGQIAGGGDAGSGTVAVSNVERVTTGAFNDRFSGNSAANLFDGRGGNDTLSGGTGNDTLTGGTGNDFFVFDTAPTSNVERITDFSSAPDQLQFENAIFTAIGASGTFAAGDGRFWAAAGATTGHDANDRVVYNTSTGSLYYDADGSGAGAAQLVATFQGNPSIAATDITVI